jgi:hypothetical protein
MSPRSSLALVLVTRVPEVADGPDRLWFDAGDHDWAGRFDRRELVELEQLGDDDGTDDSGSGGGSADTIDRAARDLGVMPDFGDPGPAGCKGKIDFLFVISRDRRI